MSTAPPSADVDAAIPAAAVPAAAVGGPVWEVATLFPPQGEWTWADLDRLSSERPIELSNGCLEFLPMPVWLHETIIDFFTQLMKATLEKPLGGRVLGCGLRMDLFPGTSRLADVKWFSPEDMPAEGVRYPPRCTIGVEVVSDDPESIERDYHAKRADYARAGFREYWIVDPQAGRITVLVLDGDAYRQHGVFTPGQTATSATFPTFECDVAAALRGDVYRGP